MLALAVIGLEGFLLLFSASVFKKIQKTIFYILLAAFSLLLLSVIATILHKSQLKEKMGFGHIKRTTLGETFHLVWYSIHFWNTCNIFSCSYASSSSRQFRFFLNFNILCSWISATIAFWCDLLWASKSSALLVFEGITIEGCESYNLRPPPWLTKWQCWVAHDCLYFYFFFQMCAVRDKWKQTCP